MAVLTKPSAKAGVHRWEPTMKKRRSLPQPRRSLLTSFDVSRTRSVFWFFTRALLRVLRKLVLLLPELLPVHQPPECFLDSRMS